MLVIIVLNIVPIDGWKNLLLLNKNRMFQHCQNNFVKSFKVSKYCGIYKDCDKIANKLSNIKCSQVFTTHLGIAQCNEIFSCMNLSNKDLCCYFFPLQLPLWLITLTCQVDTHLAILCILINSFWKSK